MGSVAPRLSRLFSTLKDGIAVPVLVVTDAEPSPALIQQIEQAAGARSSFKSPLGHAVGIRLTREGAQRVASVPGVRVVQYDEPVGTLFGRR